VLKSSGKFEKKVGCFPALRIAKPLPAIKTNHSVKRQKEE